MYELSQPYTHKAMFDCCLNNEIKKNQISIKPENPTIHKQVYLVNHKSYENRHKMASFEPRYIYEYRIM